jgi:hypothetical protein
MAGLVPAIHALPNAFWDEKPATSAGVMVQEIDRDLL